MHALMLAGWKHWQTIKWLTAQSVWEPLKECFELRAPKMGTGNELVYRFKDRETFARNQLEEWFIYAINDGADVSF